MTQEEEARLIERMNEISAKLDKSGVEADEVAYRKAKLGVMQCLHVLLACAVVYVGLYVLAAVISAMVPSARSTIEDLGFGAVVVETL